MLNAVESKPKRFMVTIPQQLWLVLDSLSDIEGHDGVKALVEQLISQYSATTVKQLLSDKESNLHAVLIELFEHEVDDNLIEDVCRL